jgi:hypothetical protein
MKEVKLFINGEFKTTENKFISTNPANGENVATVYLPGAKEIEEVEVLMCVVLREMLFVHLRSWEAVINPVQQFFASAGVRGNFFKFSHGSSYQAFLSSPMSNLVSERYICGGISRLSGAGLFLNTRPAMSNVEPWQGHKKPPFQSSGNEGCAPVWNLSEGEQPRWVQMPTATNTSGLIERAWLRA